MGADDTALLDDRVTLTPVTAAFLLQIVNSVQLSAGADNFEEQAAAIVQAKRELSGDA